MAVSDRKGAAIAAALLPWLHAHLPDADAITLDAPTMPEAGGSSETFFLTATIAQGGAIRTARWVLRIEADGHRIYPDAAVEKQYRVLRALAQAGGVPVPGLAWYEADVAVLGAPFFLMERVEGRVPDGFHHSRGLLFDAAPARREAMWHDAIATMAAIDRVDPAPFAFLGAAHPAASGLEGELARWDRYRSWCDVPIDPVFDRARVWIADRLPAERRTGLAWGDARIANMIFGADDRVRAVIDWETASLGGGETDLGWWLYFDWQMSDGMGIPRLDGLAGREGTLRLWQRARGRAPQAMDWHEVFAAWRFGMVSARGRHLAARRGAGFPAGDPPAVRRLHELTGL